jgi:hypothetical protein
MFKKLLLALTIIAPMGSCYATKVEDLYRDWFALLDASKNDKVNMDHHCARIVLVCLKIINSKCSDGSAEVDQNMQNVGAYATQAEHEQIRDILKQFVITSMKLLGIESLEYMHKKLLSDERIIKLGSINPLLRDLQKSGLIDKDLVFNLSFIEHVSPEKARMHLAYFDNFFIQLRKSSVTMMSSKKALDLFKKIELSSETIDGLPGLVDQIMALCADGFHIIIEAILNGKLKLDEKSRDNFMQKMKAMEPEIKSKLDALILEMNNQSA